MNNLISKIVVDRNDRGEVQDISYFFHQDPKPYSIEEFEHGTLTRNVLSFYELVLTCP